MTKRIAHILFAVLVLLGAAGCERRPLEEMQEKVKLKVKVNVKAVANVTTSVYNSHIPVPTLDTDMMRVMVYDTQSKNLLAQSFLTAKETDDEGNEKKINVTLGLESDYYVQIISDELSEGMNVKATAASTSDKSDDSFGDMSMMGGGPGGDMGGGPSGGGAPSGGPGGGF